MHLLPLDEVRIVALDDIGPGNIHILPFYGPITVLQSDKMLMTIYGQWALGTSFPLHDLVFFLFLVSPV